MNLNVFNRVNLKDNSGNKGMYSEWTSVSPVVQNCQVQNDSVLEKFGVTTSRDVAISVVRQIANNLGITQAPEPSPLTTDKEVQWCMEVIGFGLTLPLSDHEAIKDCVNIYCEWLSALLPTPKACVPRPVCEEPNLYTCKIVTHFYHLFVPRKGEDWPFLYQDLGQDTINRQAVLCHRVLRTLQQVTSESKLLRKETWEALLLFLLAINDTLLAPPTVKDDVADQLCERVLSVLFEIWLMACAKCFPSPPLWKTLRECCMNWRHRVALIEQWNRVNLALTSKVLRFMYGVSFAPLKIGDDDPIPQGMSNDCISQTWYRFLHTIGNPVNLTKPEVISQTQKFLQFAISSDSVVDPCQHPCLPVLPLIFLKAMKGIAAQVDAFLGIAQPVWWEDMVTGARLDKNKELGVTRLPSYSRTPPTQRKLSKSFSIAQSSLTKGSSRSSIAVSTSGPIAPSSASTPSPINEEKLLSMNRPKCNSILHLFGEWLFEAAYIGCIAQQPHNIEQNKRPNSLIVDGSKLSLNLAQPDSLASLQSLPSSLTIDKYEGGRAEALGALCRIMCAKKTGEEILPVYLARFYLAVQQGLKPCKNHEYSETIIYILMNCSDLFRVDLDGARLLLPSFIYALEMVLPDKDLKLPSNISKVELRRASIHLLLSILVLPLHFQNISIKELIDGTEEKPVTFSQLKPKLVNLVMNALQVESDPQNTHMLLGGLFLCVQDCALYEGVEQDMQPSNETLTNLLNSVSDAVSTDSMVASLDYSSTQSGFDLPGAPDSAHALFVRATYLVCHRLISSWKTDLNISLAALELLSGLARIHVKESDALECKRAVKWLCDYIVYQCSRPPPSHSKDLHSTIVAAFHCCSIWLLEHPYLLKDKDCLTTVLEVAELGVSGTKSIGKPGENIKLKDEKELKPVSMRVRDAAEYLLTCILEQVEYFPNECGPEAVSSLLDEVSLLKHCNSWPKNCSDKSIALERFRYFVSESSIMLALLEEPLGNDQDPQPTVTILIRGPFGRHAWTMQLRHLPRHRSGTKYHAPNPGRPVAMQDAPVWTETQQKYFPDSVERIIPCKIDQSIRSIAEVVSNDEVAKAETDKLLQLLERQVIGESDVATAQSVPAVECVAPRICEDFQTARLFLSHFGFLSFNTDKGDNLVSPTLAALDNSVSDFSRDLSELDDMSPRTCDTVHIFYVRSQQNTAQEIVNNVLHKSGVSPHFLEFIHTLGWPVFVDRHPGWTGHTSTSWNIAPKSNPLPVNTDHGGCLYNGQSQVLYWADACSEIAFLVPSQIKSQQSMESSETSSLWRERSMSENSVRDKKESLELTKQKSRFRRSGNRQHQYSNAAIKIMVVWLECYEDYVTFPTDELLHCTHTGLEVVPPRPNDALIIYLHYMDSGLLRVHLDGPKGKIGLASPLVDGMVISRRSLGPLVRQTSLNMARRSRLDSDVYQPPHVRRRLKVEEMAQKYKRDMAQPELLTYLFSSP